MNEKHLTLLKKHEGLRLKPYKCTAGKLTIGFGINLDAGISKKMADEMLNIKISEVEYELKKELPWITAQPDEVQGILTNMAFQMGVEGLKKFKKTLSLIMVGEYNKASKEMLKSAWAKQTPARAKELSDILSSVV